MSTVQCDLRRAIIQPTGEAVGPPPYEVLCHVRERVRPETVVETVVASGLQGRGGAGFPAGKKLQLACEAAGACKYVVVNGAEDEPGSRKDQFLLERFTAKVVEGAAIAAYAVGAKHIVFYLSELFELSLRAVEEELRSGAGHGITLVGLDDAGGAGEGLMTASIVSAPSTYVAGEDTAALEVIEGRDGLPRRKPPYPVSAGLWGQPTLASNVETLATLPAILWRGADWYRSLGTASSPGTMLFTLGDEMSRPGVYELELGTPLRYLVAECGGGLRSGLGIRAVLPGGPSSGFLAGDAIEVPLDYVSLRSAGSALGCGVITVYDESECMVEVLRGILAFFARECCGQCPPCRMETALLQRIIDQVADGTATPALLAKVPEVLEFAGQKGGICTFISMPRLPVTSAITLFGDEFEYHLRNGGRCPLEAGELAGERKGAA